MGKRKRKAAVKKSHAFLNKMNEMVVQSDEGILTVAKFLDTGKTLNRCCVKGCRSNSDSRKKYVPVFEFPQDEESLSIWLERVPIGDVPISECVVCLKHFSEDMIETTDEVIIDDENSSVDQDNVKLKAGAYPTLLPKRHHFEGQQVRASKRSKKLHDDAYAYYMEDDRIKSFEDFQSCVSEKINGLLSEDICIRHSPFTSFIMFLDTQRHTEVVKNILVHNDMMLEVFLENDVIALRNFDHILESGKIKLWSQMVNIFSMVKGMSLREASSGSSTPSQGIFEMPDETTDNPMI